MNESLQIEFLRDLIIESPSTALLKVNGFYSEFISEESFQKLFHFDNYSDRKNIVNYIIPLTAEMKPILLEVLSREKEQFIYDLTHFCIKNNSELLFVSYDEMATLQIQKSAYKGLSDLNTTKYLPLEIEKCERINDQGFFDDIQKPAPNIL